MRRGLSPSGRAGGGDFGEAGFEDLETSLGCSVGDVVFLGWVGFDVEEEVAHEFVVAAADGGDADAAGDLEDDLGAWAFSSGEEGVGHVVGVGGGG